MKIKTAIALHCGDQVIVRDTKEAVMVISAIQHPEDENLVIVEGVGDKSGYSHWLNSDLLEGAVAPGIAPGGM